MIFRRNIRIGNWVFVFGLYSGNPVYGITSKLPRQRVNYHVLMIDSDSNNLNQLKAVMSCLCRKYKIGPYVIVKSGKMKHYHVLAPALFTIKEVTNILFDFYSGVNPYIVHGLKEKEWTLRFTGKKEASDKTIFKELVSGGTDRLFSRPHLSWIKNIYECDLNISKDCQLGSADIRCVEYLNIYHKK